MSSNNFKDLIDQIGNMTVFQLSDFIKEIENTFGVSASAPVAQVQAQEASSQPASQSQEAKAEVKVELTDAGSDKIKVIKALRASTNPQMELGVVKKIVEGAPSVIAESMPTDSAKKLKEAVEAAGGKVKLS
jgi:large subunit ribosomal protein L7/L12